MWKKCERDVQNYNENSLFGGLLINFKEPDFIDIQGLNAKRK